MLVEDKRKLISIRLVTPPKLIFDPCSGNKKVMKHKKSRPQISRVAINSAYKL